MVVEVPIPVGLLDGSLREDEVENGQELHEYFEASEGHLPKDVMVPALESGRQSRRRATGFESAKESGSGLHAAANGDATRLQELLALGWSARTVDRNGTSALQWAAGSGNVDVCAVLVAAHADPSTANPTGRDALHWAARNGHVDCCKWLVQHSANALSVTKDGVNAFHWAVYGAHVAAAQWALESGINKNSLNRWGCGAIHWATASGNLDICRWLHSNGLDFSLRNHQGHDGLAKAAWNGHTSLCQWLLGPDVPEVGIAQIIATDRSGISPPELAVLNGFPALGAWLTEIAKGCGNSVVSTQAETGKDVSSERKAFSIFYRRQLQLSHVEWGLLERELLRPLPIVVRVRSECAWLQAVIHADKRWQRLSWMSPVAVWKLTPYNYKSSAELREFTLGASQIGRLALQDASSMVACLLLKPAPHHNVLVLDMVSCGSSCDVVLHLMQHMESCHEMHLSGTLLAVGREGKKLLEVSEPLRRDGHVQSFFLVASPSELPDLVETACVAEQPMVESSFGYPRSSTATCTSRQAPCMASLEDDKKQTKNRFMFDRVLCAPPSSADGSLRSHPDQWNTWASVRCFDYHELQLRHLMRALHHCSPGGLVVYTTESLNPVENEAVILEVLKRCAGAVVLEDAASLLGAQVEVMCGLQEWVVPDPGGLSIFRFLERWEDVPAHHRKPDGPLIRSMFPEDDCGQANNRNASGDPATHWWCCRSELRKCVRMLPHKADGSGHFVALLKREVCAKDPIIIEESSHKRSTPKPVQNFNPATPPSFAKLYEPLPLDGHLWQSLADYYGIDVGLIMELQLHLFIERSAGGGRYERIVAMSDGAARLLVQSGIGDRKCKFALAAAVGTPLLERGGSGRHSKGLVDATTSIGLVWRPHQAGAQLLGNLMASNGLRVLTLDASTTLAFLKQNSECLPVSEAITVAGGGRAAASVLEEQGGLLIRCDLNFHIQEFLCSDAKDEAKKLASDVVDDLHKLASDSVVEVVAEDLESIAKNPPGDTIWLAAYSFKKSFSIYAGKKYTSGLRACLEACPFL